MAQRTLTGQQDMFQAILDVTGWTVPAMAPGRIGKLAAALLKSGGSAADMLYRFGTVDPGEGWWYWRDDWRGQRGQAPNEPAIRENWLAWRRPAAVHTPVGTAQGRQASSRFGMVAAVEKLRNADRH